MSSTPKQSLYTELLNYICMPNVQACSDVIKGSSYSLFFRYVTDATVAVFIAVLLFVLPSKLPGLCLCRSQTERSYDIGENTLYVIYLYSH